MLQAITRRVTFARALRSKRFALLWSGQTISSLGDGAFFTALAWQVLTLTGSGTAMGLALVAETTPIVLFMLIGGVVADRLPRRLTMLWSDVGRAVVTLVVAGLGIAGLLQFWHLLVLAFLFGLAEAFFRPAYQSIPPEIVPAEDLPSANALTSLSRNVSTLIGPAVGAALVGLSSASLAFAFDGLTFIVSAVCLLLMGQVDKPHAPYVAPVATPASGDVAGIETVLAARALEAGPTPGVMTAEIEAPAPVRSTKGLSGMLADIREGISYITGSTWLWLTIALAALGNVGMAPLQVALPKLVHDTYHQGVWLLGATLSATAVGSMAAALIMGQIKRIRRRGLLAYLGLLLTNVAEIAFGLPLARQLAPGLPLVAGAAIGVGVGFFEIIWITTLQELVPADKLGRVSSVDWMGSLLLQPVGLAVIGALTDVMGPAWVFIAGGALNLALTLIGLASREIRALD
jgi:MFS family permease